MFEGEAATCTDSCIKVCLSATADRAVSESAAHYCTGLYRLLPEIIVNFNPQTCAGFKDSC